MGSGTTAEWSLPYPVSTDPNNVPSDMQSLATSLDGLILGGASGTLAARPAAGKARRVYYATDTGLLYYDTGSAWVYFSPGSALVSAKGDLLVGASANTLARLAVGSDGQVLTARSTSTNGVEYETKSLRTGHTWNISGSIALTTADENPYPGFQVAIPTSQLIKLHGVAAVAPGATTGWTYKLRRYNSGAWADIAGFGTTASPLTSGTSGSGTTTAPGDINLADGDVLGLWVVGAGTGTPSGLRVTVFLDLYLN